MPGPKFGTFTPSSTPSGYPGADPILKTILPAYGKRVNLSASATTERVRPLESIGVITGYRAEVDLTRVGYPVLAVVSQTQRYRGPQKPVADQA